MIFFVFIVACLAGAVLFINQTLSSSGTAVQDYQSGINAGSIDEATLTRIQSLHTSNQPTELPVLPQGRINPLSE